MNQQKTTTVKARLRYSEQATLEKKERGFDRSPGGEVDDKVRYAGL